MTALNTTTAGGYRARKVIPQDVRAEYQRLFGAAWEAKLALPAGMPPHQARARFSEWLAEVEARIEAIRLHQRGEGQGLSREQARALAGEWYTWFVSRHERRPDAQGDYSPDELPRQFPPFNREAKVAVRPWSLFEMWVKAKKPATMTVMRWRGVLLALDATFKDAHAITEDQARAWIQGLVTGKRTARTVRETWLTAASRIFRYGVDHKLIKKNPFAGIKVEVPKGERRRVKAFTAQEAETILRAALASDWHESMTASARRWVPFLCAYSGARAGEVCQLRGQDVQQVEGVWAMTLTPEAGSIKTGEARTVPLHEHLIEQGFLEFVKARGASPLFYQPDRKDVEADPANPKSSKPMMLRSELAKWVRSIGVTDKRLSPNHSWRHTFKKIADKAGISERTSDAITGHAPTTAGRGYGRADVADMAAALAKFPRYKT